MQGSSVLRTVTCPLALSLLLVLPSFVSLTLWLNKAGGPQPSAHESCVENRACCLPSLFPGKDSSLLWGTLEHVRHLLSQTTANQLCPQETSDQERVMGMNMRSVGREGCTMWLWLLEVVREVPSKVLCTLPCQNPQQMSVLPGDHWHDHSSVNLQHPYGTMYRKE